MSTVSRLETIRDNILSRLEDITASNKPSYTVGDRSISWGDYQALLLKQLNDVNEQINALSPYEIRTLMY